MTNELIWAGTIGPWKVRLTRSSWKYVPMMPKDPATRDKLPAWKCLDDGRILVKSPGQKCDLTLTHSAGETRRDNRERPEFADVDHGENPDLLRWVVTSQRGRVTYVNPDNASRLRRVFVRTLVTRLRANLDTSHIENIVRAMEPQGEDDPG
jgi:hypothetical protein